jgi:hypothetical protein
MMHKSAVVGYGIALPTLQWQGFVRVCSWISYHTHPPQYLET